MPSPKKSEKEEKRQNNHPVRASDFRALQESFMGDPEVEESVYC